VVKRLVHMLIAIVALTALGSLGRAQAAEPIDYQPGPQLSEVFITAFQTSDRLDYVELYNGANTVTNLHGWTVRYGYVGMDEATYCETRLDRYLLSGDYGLVADYDAVVSNEQVLALATCPHGGLFVSFIELRDSEGRVRDRVQNLQPADADKSWVRRNITATYRTGVFATDFRLYNNLGTTYHHAGIAMYTGGWYVSPLYNSQLRIVEIVANPRGCSPVESALDCADYVKIYVGNASNEEVARYSLRSDSGGIRRTASNGQDLANFPITDEGYVTVPITVTNTGGYVWIEDLYGVQRYDESVIAYPDAGATSKRGYAWMLDTHDGQWKWTAAPRPDAANHFYLPPVPVKAVAASTLTPCREGQERNPATNRCRSIVDAIAELVPCREGQERNPATNRCRSVLATSSALVPCQDGYERNPETNRCRKITLASSSIPSVKDVETKSKASTTGWLVAGVAVALAGGYALYEWRDDIRRKFTRSRK